MNNTQNDPAVGCPLERRVGGWISVDDRLPNFVEASLYAIPFLVMRDGDRTPSIGYFYIGWDYPWSSAGTKAVTHWMPLPEAPNA